MLYGTRGLTIFFGVYSTIDFMLLILTTMSHIFALFPKKSAYSILK